MYSSISLHDLILWNALHTAKSKILYIELQGRISHKRKGKFPLFMITLFYIIKILSLKGRGQTTDGRELTE
ncbi:hypothetical protein BH10PSE19_BH10PSE19_00310 [soil metagenome]